MGMSRKWLNVVRRKFNKKSQRDITIHHSPSPSQEAIIRQVLVEEAADIYDIDGSASSKHQKRELTKEDIAAVKIQAIFRGHLARRAFRALKSLIKVQALVRGVYVRRQTRIALHCMHALVRLQVRVRARQLLRQ